MAHAVEGRSRGWAALVGPKKLSEEIKMRIKKNRFRSIPEIASGGLRKKSYAGAMSAAANYRHYMDIVKRPGKFEGEAPYVPYFYDQAMEGFGGEILEGGEDGGYSVEKFKVSKEDIAIFPELKNKKYVKLIYREDGFVVEY